MGTLPGESLRLDHYIVPLLKRVSLIVANTIIRRKIPSLVLSMIVGRSEGRRHPILEETTPTLTRWVRLELITTSNKDR